MFATQQRLLLYSLRYVEKLAFEKSQDKDLDLICLSSSINDLKSNFLM